MKKVNRLILVGNGFDLAHNLETSYNNFVLWYLKKCFEDSQINHHYEDDLITVHFKNDGSFQRLSSLHIKDVPSFVNHFYEIGFNKLKSNSFTVDGWNNTWLNPFKVNIKSKFVEMIITECHSSRWVDIENLYYDELKSIINSVGRLDKEKEIKDLNKSLETIITELQIYLYEIVQNTNSILDYNKIIRSPFEASEFVDESLFSSVQTSIGETLILNFNYTPTVEQYLSGPNLEINYIHGQLRSTQNPVIFGFGDELDPQYSSFELAKTKGIFDFIKSFWYFKTSNYRDLIRFIESNDYQIYILGHSCGLSDRTMLNMIFEHDNCRSIKIYYHHLTGKNNYTGLTQEVSRHFKDKQKMRRRIVPFNKSEPMPQITK